jgi:hypothetical protein
MIGREMFQSRSSIIWAILVALSVVSLFAVENDILRAGTALVVIAVAGIKARLIMTHFMETELAPKAWRRMYGAWILVASTIILVGNYVAVLQA